MGSLGGRAVLTLRHVPSPSIHREIPPSGGGGGSGRDFAGKDVANPAQCAALPHENMNGAAPGTAIDRVINENDRVLLSVTIEVKALQLQLGTLPVGGVGVCQVATEQGLDLTSKFRIAC